MQTIKENTLYRIHNKLYSAFKSLSLSKVLSLLLLSTPALVTSAEAQDTQFPFIGAAAGYYQVASDAKGDSDHAVGMFRLGLQSLRWRMALSLEYGNDYDSTGVAIDHILVDEFLGTPKVRPYIGANFNYLHYKDAQAEGYDTGYSYGLQAGFIIYASERVDIDISYRYDLIGSIQEVDHFQGAILSVNYFF